MLIKNLLVAHKYLVPERKRNSGPLEEIKPLFLFFFKFFFNIITIPLDLSA